MDNYEILHSNFNIMTHKSNFTNYLEVVILENGTVKYAVPSHQEKVINICLNKLNIDRKTLEDMCPQEYHGNYMYWLCLTSKTICVWNDCYIGKLNDKQRGTLFLLKRSGLYKGKI